MRYNKKQNFGTGKGVISLPVGFVGEAILLGYSFQLTREGKTNTKAKAALAELEANLANEDHEAIQETILQDWIAKNSQLEDFFWQSAVINIDTLTTTTLDLGFGLAPKPIKVVKTKYLVGDVEKDGKGYEIASVAELKAYQASMAVA